MLSCRLPAGWVLLWGAVLPAALFGQPAPSDWPGFRGPTGQGGSADRNLPVTWSDKENVAWKVELPAPGTSSPVVVGKRLYLTGYTGYSVPGRPKGRIEDLKLHVFALDRDSGKVLWNKEVTPEDGEPPTIRDDHGYASSTPACDGERLCVHFGKTGVFAFDLDGNQLWRTPVGSKVHGWGSAASPVLHENLVIVNAAVESESLYGLDRKTGKEVWRATGIKESWNTPILVPVKGGKPELVVAVLGRVLGFDPDTGKQLWSCKTDIGWYMVPSLVAHDGVVYCIGGRGTGGALAVRAGGRGEVTATHRLWTGRKGSNVTSPLYHDGHLYWMHENNGVAYCAEAKTGDLVYEQRVERLGQVYASPVLADGKIYYLSRDGRVAVVAASPKFERLAMNHFSDRCAFNASPAVAGSRLYVRSDRFLYCLGAK
jgi:hypothetical protein